MTNDDVASLVDEGAEHGKLPKPWSAPVRVKVARGILGTLRDVGFLRDGLRGRREVIHYHLSEQGTACIARILHEEGFRHSGLSEHADWKLFGLGAAEVAEKLDELGEARAPLVQRAGSVVSLTWRVGSMEDLLHAHGRLFFGRRWVMRTGIMPCPSIPIHSRVPFPTNAGVPAFCVLAAARRATWRRRSPFAPP